MSGGPLYAAQAGGVHVVGVLSRRSPSGLIGIPVSAAGLATLRSRL
jgi:hypothetical protein